MCALLCFNFKAYNYVFTYTFLWINHVNSTRLILNSQGRYFTTAACLNRFHTVLGLFVQTMVAHSTNPWNLIMLRMPTLHRHRNVHFCQNNWLGRIVRLFMIEPRLLKQVDFRGAVVLSLGGRKAYSCNWSLESF